MQMSVSNFHVYVVFEVFGNILQIISHFFLHGLPISLNGTSKYQIEYHILVEYEHQLNSVSIKNNEYRHASLETSLQKVHKLTFRIII